jgi:hypothetical protein
MKTIIQFGDKPNRNGRVYSREVVKGIVNKIKGKKDSIFITSRPPEESFVYLHDVIAYVRDVEYNEENNSIVLELVPVNNVLEIMSNGKDFRNYFRLVPSGIGVVVDGGIIMEYELICFYMVPREDSPFEELVEVNQRTPESMKISGDGIVYEGKFGGL